MASPTAFLRKLERRVRSQMGLGPAWTTQRLFARTLVLRDGTIRTTADYDDAWIYACVRHSRRMFDVGANVGNSALLALVGASVAQVVLIEANWEALAIAAENLIRNGLSARARFVGAFAAEASDRTVELWTVGTGAAGSMYRGHATTAGEQGSVKNVATVSLDDLSDAFGVPDFVKVDVEGAEARVLQGSARFASRHETRFLVEMHSPPELSMAKNAELVLRWANSLGYSAWYLSEATRIESPEPIRHRGRCHLLLQPTDWPYPSWLVAINQSDALPEQMTDEPTGGLESR